MSNFNDWFAINHPADWWASERNGESLPHRDRLRVSEFSRKAYEQGIRDERERCAKIADEELKQSDAPAAYRIAAAIRKED